MIAFAQDSDGLAAVASKAKADRLGTDWAASLADLYGPESRDGTESVAAVSQRARRIRLSPMVRDTARAIEAQLFLGAREWIDAKQREVYTRDQELRAKILDAQSNPAWKVAATVTVDELERLAEIPLEGYERDEWLAGLSSDFRSQFVAATVRSLASISGGFRVGVNALAAAMDRVFETWLTKARHVANVAALAALNASSKEALLAFIPPDQRQRAGEQVAA